MVHYTAGRPKVYIETTVVSYLVARPSNDITVFDRQRLTRQLWVEYSDAFEFVTSDGYQPTTLCTPEALMEEMQMKEQLEPQTDPILEECYRIKAEFSAQFNSLEELYDYLKAREKEGEAQGKIYIDPPSPPAERIK